MLSLDVQAHSYKHLRVAHCGRPGPTAVMLFLELHNVLLILWSEVVEFHTYTNFLYIGQNGAKNHTTLLFLIHHMHLLWNLYY